MASSSAISFASACSALGRPKSPQEWPPGPDAVIRSRLLPTATIAEAFFADVAG
jgi:hypothetical protein